MCLRLEKLGETKKLINYFYLLPYSFAWWILSTCTRVDTLPVAEPCSPASDQAVLDVVDTLEIRVPEFAFPYYDQLFLKGNMLYAFKAASYQIDLYDLAKESFYKSIHLDPNFVNNLGAFYVHNEDSIFITQELTDVLLLNGQGVVTDRFDLGKAPVKWTGNFDMPEYFFYSQSIAGIYYDADNYQLVVTLTSPEIWYYKNRANFHMHGTYNIKTRQWVKTFGYLPGYYQMENKALPFILSNPYCLFAEGNYYVTFPMDPDIYLFDSEGQLTRIVCAEGNLKLAQPYSYKKIDDLELQRRFLLENGWYGRLNYHSQAGVFSRVYVGNAIRMDKDKSIRTTGVVLLDKELNKIGEYSFEESMPIAGVGGEGFTHGLATPDGFIGSFKPDYYTSDDQLRYGVRFIIKKE